MCVSLALSTFLAAQTGTQPRPDTLAFSPAVGHNLPDAPSASVAQVENRLEAAGQAAVPHWKPLSTGQKFDRFVAGSYSSSSLFFAGIAAQSVPLQPFAQEPQRGLRHRYVISYADAQSSAFIEGFLLPALTGQDPRYFRKSTGSGPHRFGYAMSRVLITRNDSGENVFNTSGVTGAFLSSAVHNAYHPYYNHGVNGTASRALGNLATRAAMNVLREFWPDMRGRRRGWIGSLMSKYRP